MNKIQNPYIVAGEEPGIRKLCEDFYHLMDTKEEAREIRHMHTDSLEIMIDKLTLFLCMWLGGPRWYVEKYKFVGMPQAHRHLVINEPQRDAWLLCMDEAIEKQLYEEDFKEFLRTQFRFPANMIMEASAARS